MIRPLPPAAAILGVATVYFAGAKLGLSMAFAAEQVTAVWPPTGIALAALLLLGRRVWPGITLGAFLANILAHEPIGTAWGIAVGNTLEALVSVELLRRWGFRPALDRLRDVLGLVVFGAGFSTLVSATIGPTSLCLGGVHPWSAFRSLFTVWWIGDAIGDLVMAPLLLVWARPLPRPRTERLVEAAIMIVGLVGVGLAIFAGQLGTAAGGYPLQYTIFPFVVWGALRFGQRGTTAVIFVSSSLAIWSTVNGWGPFASASQHESLMLLQLFMAVMSITALLLGAAISERDMAERRAGEELALLHASEERLRLALEAGRMGVWDWNLATGEVKWSESLEPLHGLPPGGFSGTFEGFQALVHPEDRARVNAAIARAVDSRTGYDVEFRVVWPDQSVHWMAGKGRVFTGGRRGDRMIGIGMDVTDRKRLEEELRRRAQDLSDADRRKDEFLAMLAHELRNPLAPLSTTLHLLARESAGSQGLLDIANRQVKHLARLVEDLLDVSRITQGKITLRKEIVDLGQLVERAVEMIRPLVDARGHKFTISLPPSPVRLEADPARLAQVLANLLSNAAKYTPPAGSIWLTGERVGDELVLRVRDTGPGIAADILPHIFDLFVQGDASLDRTRGGLGIGLTIVRRLVEMHGGRVEARSPGLGQGSEFVVHLPVVRAPFAEPREEVAGAPVRGSGRGLRVLVVEDSQDAAESLAAVLQIWGHETEVAFDGVSAVDAAERFSPEVIISDLGLPGLDGYALARRLRAHPAFGRVVLIAISGYGRDEDKQHALEAGFDHHLVKPPDLHVLQQLLGRVAAATGDRPSRTLH